MNFPGVAAVLCVVPSGLVLHIGLTSCTFSPWTEMSKKNDHDNSLVYLYSLPSVSFSVIGTQKSLELDFHAPQEEHSFFCCCIKS